MASSDLLTYSLDFEELTKKNVYSYKEFYIQTNEYMWYLPVLATPFSIFF
jgi:hypothetical protein